MKSVTSGFARARGRFSKRPERSGEPGFLKIPAPRCVDQFGRGQLFGFLQARHWLATGEAGLKLVPEADFFLAELPAEADVAALMAADEIDQAVLRILQLAADAVQLIDERLKAFDRLLVLPLLSGGVFLVARCRRTLLQRLDLFVHLDDVSDDPLDERQGAVGLGEGEPLSR